MPKKRAARSRPRTAADRLRQDYGLGREALRRGESASGVYARGVIVALAEEHGLRRNTVAEARRIAELYSEEEFAEFCRSGLSRTHLSYLLWVPNKTQRRRLQRKAAKEGWSARQLLKEIRRTVGRKKGARGRKPVAPGNPEEAFDQIREHCEKWLWWQVVISGEKNNPADIELPPEVTKRLRAATRAVRRLKTAVTD